MTSIREIVEKFIIKSIDKKGIDGIKVRELIKELESKCILKEDVVKVIEDFKYVITGYHYLLKDSQEMFSKDNLSLLGSNNKSPDAKKEKKE